MRVQQTVFFSILGAVFWLGGTQYYRAQGAALFEGTRMRYWLNFVLTPIVSVATCIVLFRGQHLPSGQWPSAGLLIAVPGLFGEALVFSRFSRWMPGLRVETGNRYAAFLFATYGLVLMVCEGVGLAAAAAAH